MSIHDLTRRRTITRTAPKSKLDPVVDKLGEDGLARLITAARSTQPPVGWRTIARSIEAETGVTVTHETVRTWYQAISQEGER
jgi:hypothetical protein